MKLRHILSSIILYFVLLVTPFLVSAYTIEISAIVPGCGNNIIESGEQCDGTSFGGATCNSRGYTGGGTLSCTEMCTFNVSMCTVATIPPSGGGGGGGGSDGGTNIPLTNVVFVGKAYPRSTITLLKDAQVVATTISDAGANFQITISGISGGNYFFSLYSEDSKGNRSSLLTFPVGIKEGVTTKIGDIYITPTIAVDKSEVKRGDNIIIFGQSSPLSEVTISVNSDEEHFVKRITDAAGAYLLNFDTSVLELGQHNTKSKVALNGEISSFSKVVGFTVGTKNVYVEPTSTSTYIKGDLNNDGKVNLVDFSIASYWYKFPLSSSFKVIEKRHLNGDGKIDLLDFSMIAFYWTG